MKHVDCSPPNVFYLAGILSQYILHFRRKTTSPFPCATALMQRPQLAHDNGSFEDVPVLQAQVPEIKVFRGGLNPHSKSQMKDQLFYRVQHLSILFQLVHIAWAITIHLTMAHFIHCVTHRCMHIMVQPFLLLLSLSIYQEYQ